MTAAPVAIRARGRGRQPAVVEHARDLEAELRARQLEALEACDALIPLVRRLTPGMLELGPRHAAIRNEIEARLLRFRRQWETPDPADAAEVAA